MKYAAPTIMSHGVCVLKCPGGLRLQGREVSFSTREYFARLLGCLVCFSLIHGITGATAVAADYQRDVLPLLKVYCLECHSTEKHKGDLDLERFRSHAEVLKQPKVWEKVVEQVTLGEMPPKNKPQLSPSESERLLGWVNSVLDEAARARAGDPGPVVLRRLSNAEYKYTIRDLTRVETLNPGREFPADSASGEGFMNVGNSLVMSPALLTKYLDAAKDIANHAVLLPEGIGFSPSTSARDWSEEKLAAIRAFYGRFTETGGGTAVNLQGIKFDTKDGGVLPVARYFEATLSERDALKAGRKSIHQVAQEAKLSGKYLSLLWEQLNDSKPSLLLDPVRTQWQSADPGHTAALVQMVSQWQQALWRFTTVGHIGKRDGPKAWQVPMTPLAEAREVRIKMPSGKAGENVMFYLVASDAGDGSEGDFAVWENPRLVAPGRPDLALRDVRSVFSELAVQREKLLAGAARSLVAAAEVGSSLNEAALARLAEKHGVEPVVLAAWLHCLGLGAGEARIDSYLTQKLERLENYDFVQGWSGADALSVIANASDQHVRVPGNMKPHGVAVHPAPRLRVLVGWRSPTATTLQVNGAVQHVHPECGNGVTWAVELRRGTTRQRLGAGIAHGAGAVKFGPYEQIGVQPGDLLSVVVGPREGNHSCDLTAVDLNLTDGRRVWDLASDVSPDILAGNPHADRQGNTGVWHFYSEPDPGGGPDSVLPAGSLLAKWLASLDLEEKQRMAGEVQKLLLGGAANLTKDAPDAVLYRLLTSFNGPLLSSFLRHRGDEPARAPALAGFGLDPGRFGIHPNGKKLDATSLCVRAPSVIEVSVPAEFAEGCEFVTTATLDKETGAEGSVQMQVLTTKPTGPPELVAGATKEQGGKSTWSDGERPGISESPILVREGSAARKRIEGDFDQFRQLFPAALCYTKIVPVDEVVTLTLFYREDEHLRRLMLDDAQAAELDRLWRELHYVSQDALKLVDAFEQLWQFATQDADPSAFTPMRTPILQRAEEFKQQLRDTQPAHLEAVVKFAGTAYRRPLTATEQDELRALYRRLRAEEIRHEEAIRLTLARVLVAPAFLYRAEKPGPGRQPGPVSDWELASRLSYFLWSSTPDEELRAHAASGQLQQAEVLVAQGKRMLRDPRVRRLATEFACTWLHIHDFDSFDEKSERHFPAFAALRGPMYEEAIQFFTDAFQNDASVLTFFDANHTFLNQALAEHYGIIGVTGDNWRRVDGVKALGRGGVLGFGATLAKQSGASRTSPILRGNWVAEVLLGDKLPRPPKDVPQLPEDESAETLTVRELTQKHSSDPRCAGCHVRIDGYGFALEGFDAIGRQRTRDLADRPVDTRAEVFDGTTVDGAIELREYLLTRKRDVVVNQFCRKLLGYALGRAVMLSDKPLLGEMQAQLQKQDYRFSAALDTIIRSKQFREIRGNEMSNED